MKVFNFTNGTKGELLGEIKLAGWTGGWLVGKGGKTYKVELAHKRGGSSEDWAWVSAAGYSAKGEDVAIRPEDFGVEAVCFCIGEVYHTWHAGHPEAQSAWEWKVVGTADWNRGACKSGILKAEVVA
jgi:hypothetical protein